MKVTLTVKQVKALRRILAWMLHQRNIDPMTLEDARSIYEALPHASHEGQE